MGSVLLSARSLEGCLLLFLIEVKFISTKINCFRVTDSTAFSTFTMVCRRHPCLVPKHFHHSKIKFHTHIIILTLVFLKITFSSLCPSGKSTCVEFLCVARRALGRNARSQVGAPSGQGQAEGTPASGPSLRGDSRSAYDSRALLSFPFSFSSLFALFSTQIEHENTF